MYRILNTVSRLRPRFGKDLKWRADRKRSALGDRFQRSSQSASLNLNRASVQDTAPSRCGRRAWALAVVGLANTLIFGGCMVGAAPQRADFVEVIRHVSPAVVGVGDDRGVIGSGFRLMGTRHVVTAAHLLTSLRGSLMVIWNERRWPARMLRRDADTDLALLELEGDPPMPGLSLWAGEAPRPGEWIVVLGRPFGANTTATAGIVSAEPGAVKEPAALRSRMQLNAAVNPGNSGGPVVNLAGKVVGLASAFLPAGSGLAFAVPATTVQAFVQAPS